MTAPSSRVGILWNSAITVGLRIYSASAPAFWNCADNQPQCLHYVGTSALFSNPGTLSHYRLCSTIGRGSQWHRSRSILAFWRGAGSLSKCRHSQQVPALPASAGTPSKCRHSQQVPAPASSAGTRKKCRHLQEVPALTRGTLNRCRYSQQVPPPATSAGTRTMTECRLLFMNADDC
jgi:hypothetical protein